MSTVGGTHLYMAPELQQGSKPTTASDVYALGVLVYLSLPGAQRPVGADSVLGRVERMPTDGEDEDGASMPQLRRELAPTLEI